jgi:hypothetical protein
MASTGDFEGLLEVLEAEKTSLVNVFRSGFVKTCNLELGFLIY